MAASDFGTIVIDGKRYVERIQVFPSEVTVTSTTPNQNQLAVVLPGVANFRLKALTRQVLAGSPPAPVIRPFRFRLGNSDGSTNYISGGVGGTTDLVIDSNVFGTGQFPYPIVPAIFFGASASIRFQVEDLSATFPYTIYFGFHGAYLIPA